MDISAIRGNFPAIKDNNLIFFDGPGGTQVPESVIQAQAEYYRSANSNTHGYFPTSVATDKVIADARGKCGALLNAESPECISFGQNMTTLTYSLSRALVRSMQAGDEIIITQLDHEANRGPWIGLEEFGIVVREVRLLPHGVLDYEDLESKLNEKTKLVALGWASNALGTVNDIRLVRKLTYTVGAHLLLDAVHYAPHFSIDVQEIGCDFLLCSAYKFYGPHVGVLYSKPGLLDRFITDCLRTQDPSSPYKIETGTLNHAALAGVSASIDFLAGIAAIAKSSNGNVGFSDLRKRLLNTYEELSQYENHLGRTLYKGLNGIKGLSVVGPDFAQGQRAPTVSVFSEKLKAAEICKRLSDQGICAWDGHFYAIRAIEVLGLFESGGVTRFGVSAYTSQADVDRVISAMKDIMASQF